LNPAGPCVPDIDDSTYPNMVFLTSIDKNSVIGQGFLQSVVFAGTSKSTVGTQLSSILFNAGELLNFDAITPSEVTFNLYNMGLNHHKVFVRINAFSSCSNANNQTLVVSTSGITRINETVSTFKYSESTLIPHTSSSFSFKVSFGTAG
jgi:hypothetical protein